MLRLVLVGKSGAGKSCSGNTILGREEFQSHSGFSSVMRHCEKKTAVVDGKTIAVVDTPGLSQRNTSDQNIISEVLKCIELSNPGPHAFLLVLQIGRFTQEEKDCVHCLLTAFGEDAAKYMMVLFTCGDQLKGSSIESLIKDCAPDSDIRVLLKRCGDRYHLFNNTDRKNHAQVTQLLKKIDSMVAKNGGSCYTQDMFRAAERKIREKEDLASRERRLVLVGSSGVGKSASANTILGRQEFRSKCSFTSVTQHCTKGTTVINGRRVDVIDSPSFVGRDFPLEDIITELIRCVQLCSPGPHAFLLVLQIGRFTSEERSLVEVLQKLFGEGTANYVIILFTHGESLKDEIVESLIENADGDFQELIRKCGGRYHTFSNTDPGNRSQVTKLLDVIDEMVAANGGTCYTSEIYAGLEGEILQSATTETSRQQGWLQTLKDKHKAALKRKFEVVSEGIAKPGEQTLLNDVFTHVWITEGSCVEVNHGHEVMQVETVSKITKSEIRSIKCSDIFKPLPGQTRPIRTVLMKGVAGIGKTFSVQKFILNWATGKDNQDFDFIFFLPFCKLNLIKSEMSLQELVQCFCPEIKSSANILDCCKVLFIFDGLDGSRHPLNFRRNQIWSDVKKTTSVDILIINLINGNFPVDASIWITSRTASAGLIPPELISRVTEVQGFEDQQKEEYIRKKCKKIALADRIISHLKTQRSLYMMCHVPVFCWIVVTILEHTLKEKSGESPRTLTDFYTNFLLVLLTAKEEKEEKENVLKSHHEAILKLGKLAFESLEKNIIVFSDKDLKKYNIDLNNCSLHSGLFKEIFKQDSVLFQEKVYSFLHLTVQEYYAALYVLGSHQNSNINPLEKGNPPASTLFHLNEVVLGRAIQSRTGHLDLFVRFLLGMGMKNNQELLKGFLSHMQNYPSDIQKTTEHIKKLIRETSSPERCINLFHCLSELKDQSLMDEFNVTLDKVKHSRQRLSPSQCSALAYFSLLSEKEFDVFDMSEYATSEECTRRLLPVAKITKTLRMERCGLTERCCEDLASALQSQQSSLTVLDLSENKLGDSGVKLLSAALRDPNCKLTKLWMWRCELTMRCCEDLASVLQSQHSSLRELGLSKNNLGDSGVNLLSAALRDPNCKLTELQMRECGLTERCCEDLASALQSQYSSLRELNLSKNNLGDSGVKLLSAALRDPNCKLTTLWMSKCGLTERCCEDLASVLQSQHSILRDLFLSDNNLGDSGLKLLSAALRDPNCKLTGLWMWSCKLTERCCVDLASALQSQHSSLRELDLSDNNLGDLGVKLLSAALREPNCKLTTLKMWSCKLTERCCEDLASALQSQHSSLRELNLSFNNLGDSGVKLLSAALRDPNCKLTTLRMRFCKLTERCCEDLASVLQSQHSSLTELDLSGNELGVSGVKVLSAAQRDPNCKLTTLKTWRCTS